MIEIVIRLGMLLCAVLWGLSFWADPGYDTDLGWQLFGGAWITGHRSLPLFDPVNSLNSFWHDYHWLWQLLLYRVYDGYGYQGVRGMHAFSMILLALSVLAVVFRTTRFRSGLPQVLVFLLALFLLGRSASIRSQIVALTGVGFSVALLAGKRVKAELPILFLITAVLVNVHVYWVLIPLVWVCYRCVPRVLGQSDLSAGQIWGGLVLLLAAAFVSPYTALPLFPSAINYALILEYLNTPNILIKGISEFGDISRAGAQTIRAVILVAFLSGFYIIAALRGRKFGDILLLVIGLLTATRMIRLVAVLALFMLPFVGRASCYAEIRVTHWLGAFKTKRISPALFAITTLMLGVVLVSSAKRTWRFAPWRSPGDLVLTMPLPNSVCTKVAGISLNPTQARDHLRVVTSFNDGGWCRWFMHMANPNLDARVTFDPRTQWVPERQIWRNTQLLQVGPTYQNILNEWSPEVAVLSTDSPLRYALEYNLRWKSVFDADGYVALINPLAMQN